MATDEKKLSLAGSVSLGTGVMIGAGIFALVGQVSELAGTMMPFAFLAGAVVVGFSAYSYIRYSDTNPSSGGIAMLLKAAYGPGVVAGTFSLFMYVSMVVAQSLLGRTFGTYALRPFGLEGSALLVPVLAVTVIAGGRCDQPRRHGVGGAVGHRVGGVEDPRHRGPGHRRHHRRGRIGLDGR